MTRTAVLSWWTRLVTVVALVGPTRAVVAQGIDDRGRMISAQEYQEAVDFLADARRTAERLPSPKADTARVILDSIIAAVTAKRPPSALAALNNRFATALGSEAALDLPHG